MQGGTLQGTIFGGGRMALSGIDDNGHFPTTKWDPTKHGNVSIHVSGNATIGNSNATQLLKADESVGDIFGAGKGDVKNTKDIWAGRVANARITVKDTVISVTENETTTTTTYSPRIYGAIFGGGEMASLGYWDDTIKNAEGTVIFHTKDNVSVSYSTNYGVMYTNTGHADINLSGGLIVGTPYEYTVAPNENPGDWTIYNTAKNTLIHTCTGHVYGGGQGDVNVAKPRWVSMGRSGSSVIEINGGTYYGNIFGGAEQGIVTGDTRIIIRDGTFGYTGDLGTGLTKVYSGDIYGAGYGSDNPDDDGTTYIDEDDNISVHTAPANDSVSRESLTLSSDPTVHLSSKPSSLAGRTYGDTRVDILGGTIHGNIYGGGSFASVGYEKSSAKGNTLVNIGYYEAVTKSSTAPATAVGDATLKGEVYGANNFSGTPYGNTEVHIYKTAHTTDNTCPTAEYAKTLAAPTTELTGEDVVALPSADGNFAISAVYGGGNQAAHTPASTDGTTYVCVHYCDENTVKQVYGGSNGLGASANASTQNNHVVIEGGRIYEVFGGGNGYSSTGNHDQPNLSNYNPGADVKGTAHTEIKGGLVTNVFGGSNSLGYVGSIKLEIDKEDCDLMLANTFGGGNEAFGGGGVITLGCGTRIGNFYGGSRQADIQGNIVLNIEGGVYENVFGGSQGSNAKAANIDGNVTVNVTGGNIGTLYGGSDVNGNITGKIQVNVDLNPDYDCIDGLQLQTIYGGGNLALYTPYSTGGTEQEPIYPSSPEINIINNVCILDNPGGDLKWTTGQTVVGENLVKYFHLQNIYGGGYGDGYAHEAHSPTLTGYVRSNPVVNFGGIDMKWDKAQGDMGTLIVQPYRRNNTYIEKNIYGGGDAAPVDGNPRVTLFSSRKYLDENDVISHADKYWDTTVVHGSIFGGGRGQTARVTGNTTVGVFGDATVVIENVYGGGEASVTDGSTDVMVGYDVIAMPTIWVDKDGKVHIDCSTPGVTIYYTDDASEPSDNSTLYDGPFTPSAGATIRAIAYKFGYPPSLPTHLMKSFAPTITISNGTATLTAQDDASIYYTLDGTVPTSSSTPYNAPFSVSGQQIVKAIAISPGAGSSTVAMLKCATPAISINTNGVATVTCATPGATLRYTIGLDPTDPEAWNGTVLSGSTINVPSGQTLKVIADCPGYSPSAVASDVYTSVPVPTFTVNPNDRTVTIKSSAGTIHYTTNGDIPTAESPTYSTPLTGVEGQTIKAIAVVGTTASTVAILSPVATPTFNAASYTEGDPVTISTATSGATIYYSTNGGTTYTAGTPITSSASFNASGGTTLKAYAYKQGMNLSEITSDMSVEMCTLGIPTITITGTKFTIALAEGTLPGAVIHYTTNGNDPTVNSPIYSSAVDLPSGSTTIKAMVVRTGCNNSPIATESYCRVAEPEMSINSSGLVTITPVEGVTFHYTTDGDEPTASTPTTYSAPFTVNEGETVKAIATSANCNPSTVVSEKYCLPVTAPTLTVDSYGVVTIHCPTGCSLVYSINGHANQYTDENENGTVNVAGGDYTQDVTIQAWAVRNGCSSEEASGTYDPYDYW